MNASSEMAHLIRSLQWAGIDKPTEIRLMDLDAAMEFNRTPDAERRFVELYAQIPESIRQRAERDLAGVFAANERLAVMA